MPHDPILRKYTEALKTAKKYGRNSDVSLIQAEIAMYQAGEVPIGHQSSIDAAWEKQKSDAESHVATLAEEIQAIKSARNKEN